MNSHSNRIKLDLTHVIPLQTLHVIWYDVNNDDKKKYRNHLKSIRAVGPNPSENKTHFMWEYVYMTHPLIIFCQTDVRSWNENVTAVHSKISFNLTGEKAEVHHIQ